ncbi:MAG: cold shock domain-containing protein [Crinalium sp.]
MNTGKYRGILAKWNDDKGYGFIKPDSETKEVFLHISELKRASRRPKVGDVIFYEKKPESNGKTRAFNVVIEGVLSQTAPKKTNKKSYRLIESVIIVPVLAVMAISGIKFSDSKVPLSITSATKPECKIKGNISIETGNKIYHVPGAEDYNSTKIDLFRGEKWFCTESEAIANGWRKSPK